MALGDRLNSNNSQEVKDKAAGLKPISDSEAFYACLVEGDDGLPALKILSSDAGSSTPSVGALSQPALVSANSVEIAAAGSYPGGLMITNTTDERVYIAFGFLATTSNYSFSLAPIDGNANAETYIVLKGEFAGAINARVGANPTSGSLNVTTLTSS